MQINKSYLGGATTSVGVNAPVTSNASKSSGTDPVSAVRQTDQVEISDAARKLVEQHSAASEQLALTNKPLAASRLEEIREKLSQGVYSAPEIADHVARAILNRGDV